MVAPVRGDELDRQAARGAFAHIASAVSVITTVWNGTYRGMTIGSLCPLSIEPPMVLVSVDRRSGTYATLLRQNTFAVNVLSRDDSDLAIRFASHPPDTRFEGIDFFTNEGLPLLPTAVAWFGCQPQRVLEVADHAVIACDITWFMDAAGESFPLLRHGHRYRHLCEADNALACKEPAGSA